MDFFINLDTGNVEDDTGFSEGVCCTGCYSVVPENQDTEVVFSVGRVVVADGSGVGYAGGVVYEGEVGTDGSEEGTSDVDLTYDYG